MLTRSRERGATSLEYVLIAALLSIAIIVGLFALRSALNNNYLAVSEDVRQVAPSE